VQQELTKTMLSVVVAIVSDTTDRHYDLSQLAGCLDALGTQIDPPSMEIIVPYPSQACDFEQFRTQYPQVSFIPIDDLRNYALVQFGREHHDELRARGMSAAKGEIIGLLEDHARPDSHWSRNIFEAHQRDYPNHAAVGGAIENDVNHPLNWAIYFCDFGKYQTPISEGDTSFASDANIAYKRSALNTILPIWQNAFHETEVNGTLLSRGESLALTAGVIVYQHRRKLKLRDAIFERMIWGQSYAATRSGHLSLPKRILFAALSPFLPLLLFLRMGIMIFKKGRNLGSFIKASPIILTLLIGWSLGEFAGYLSARRKS
jgi:hypothetical protein